MIRARWFFGISFLAVSPAWGAPNISNLAVNATTIGQYEKFEISFTLDSSYSNPFDPEVIKVDGLFTSPSNQTLVHPGFYTQDYQVTGVGLEPPWQNNEVYTPTGDPVWKIRFAPREIGTYQFQVEATDSSGSTRSSSAPFEVIASTKPGFVRISGVNPRYFAFDNGKPYVGNGLDVAWWQDERGRITSYSYFLDRMGKNRCNLARVWMTNSGRDQNWILSIQDKTLGADYNLEEAWAFDQVLELAQQKEVGFLLTLDDVNQFTYNWESANLYYSGLGGPLQYRSEIFTSPLAKTYQQRVFRYVVARWGYSTSVVSWEFFNEIDELRWSDTDHYRDEDMASWHRQMADFVKSIDAHQHLTNTSTGSFKTHEYLYQALPEMEFAQIHYYYVPGWQSHPSDPAGQDMADLTRYYAYLVYSSVTNEPSIMGEFGLLNSQWTTSDYLLAGSSSPHDDQGIHLHNALWAALMSGMAATPLSFHWMEHVDYDPGWWQHYLAIANYFDGISVSNLTVMKPVNVDESLGTGGYPDNRTVSLTSSNPNLRVMGLRNGSILVYAWIQNRANTWWNYVHATAPAMESGTVTVHGLTASSDYRIEWWDSYAGVITKTEAQLADASGNLDLQLSNLEKDVSVKLFDVRQDLDPPVPPQGLTVVVKGQFR